MVNSEIAGLNGTNPDNWEKLATTYGRDRFPTGGLPAIPAAAENNGSLDPSTFDVGTVITVVTYSASKYILTVVHDGLVTVERYTWDLRNMRIGMRYYSHQEDMEVYNADPDSNDLPWQFAPNPFRVETIQADESLVFRFPEADDLLYVKTSPVAYWVIGRS